MNKTLRKFSVLILSGFLLAACGDDDDAKGTSNIEPEFPTEYSDKTVEENKSELQNNGVELVDKLTTLKSTSGIKTSIAFSEHLEGSTLPDNIEGGRVASGPAISLLHTLASLGRGKTSADKVLSGMRIAATEFESFQQYYNDIIGVYAYNKANDSWTYTKTGSKIVFQFPSTETGTTNNAEYAVYDYKGTKITSDIGGDDYTGDYPTSLKADLTVDGTKKMEFSFSTSYDSKGTPTAITNSIKIDTYTFLFELTNTTTQASIDYTLTEGSNVLFALGARGKGSFNAGDVIEEGDDAVTDASAYFQLMNIKFSGEIDAAALQTALENSNSAAETAAAWNANYQLIVFYADSKKKIADSEFYVVTETRTEQDCEWVFNEELGYEQYICGEEYEVQDEVVEVRIVFQDGSKADLETYTEVGFSTLEDKFETFVESLD